MRIPILRCLLGGTALTALQVHLIHLNIRLEGGLFRADVPALLPDVFLQAFACLLAFVFGSAFFMIPKPAGPFQVVRFAALRGLMVGLAVAAISFQLMYLMSRFPEHSGASLSACFRPWTAIVAPAVGASILPTWLSFFAFADGEFGSLDHTSKMTRPLHSSPSRTTSSWW